MPEVNVIIFDKVGILLLLDASDGAYLVRIKKKMNVASAQFFLISDQ